MSKDQVIIDGKAVFGHSSVNDNVSFVFSADKRGEVKFTAIENMEHTHLEIHHRTMSCFIPYLIEWLQEQVEKQTT